MQSMREIKLRMKSIKETRQITKAMKLIAASKLKKAKLQLERSMPYFNKVNSTIASILLHSGSIKNKYFYDLNGEEEAENSIYGYNRHKKRPGVIIFCGDKGLAGGFNSNLFKFAEAQLSKLSDPVIFVVGAMGRLHYRNKNYEQFRGFDYNVDSPTVHKARQMAEIIIQQFDENEVDEVYVIYTHMESFLKQEPTIMKILPLDLAYAKSFLENGKDAPLKQDEALVYEPSSDAVIEVLVHKYIKGVLYGAMVQSFTSELSARMAAMDNATSNADEMLEKLTLMFNRARQASITQEISEIVGGADALQ
jgi:F-type H+-transporting ATPase subunit gamma